MGLSLTPLKKLWDQVNFIDNNRTWKNPQGNANPAIQAQPNAAPPTRSVIGQLTHNGVTNTIGNFLYKPVASTLALGTVDPIRELVAQATHNTSAQAAQEARTKRDIETSVPYQIANLGVRTGQFAYNDFKAPILDIMGKTAEADRARTTGLKEFNDTPFGQLTRPIQHLIVDKTGASAQSQREVGLDPNATGAQKWIGDPVSGAIGTYLTVKGGAGLLDKGAGLIDRTTGKPVETPIEQPNTPVKVKVKDASTGKQVVKVVDPVKRVDEIQQQLATMPSPDNIEVAKFNQRQNLAKVVGQIRQSTRTPETKQALIKRVTDRYKSNLVTMEEIIRQRTALDEEASQLKMNPSYQAARPVGDKPVVTTRAVDNTLVQPSQMADSVSKIRTVMGDDELPYTRPKVSSKPDTLDMLRIKLSRVKDPVRKAELQAEIEQRFPTRATVSTKPLPVVEAQSGPNAFSRAVTSARGVISQYGEGGKEIASRLQKQRDASEIGQEGFVEKIPTVLKLNKKDFSIFVDALDALSSGKNIRVPDHIGEAILEWQKAIPTIRERAISTGIDVGDLGPNYFPRFFKNLESVKGRKQLAAEMVRNGEAKDVGDAMGKIRLMQRDYTRTFGNLEKNRTGSLGGYEKTHEALLAYISRSFDRITKAEQFGAKNEALHQLIAAAEQEGFDVRPGGTFDRTLKVAIGDTDYSTAGHKASRIVRNVNAVRSLSTSSITNATQTVNTGVIAGVGRTIVGIAKALVSKDERLGARQAGVLLDHTINDLARQGLGTSSQIMGSIASPFFRTVEKFNRTVSAIVGKDWGNTLAARAAKGSTKAEAILRDTLRVTGDIGEKLTREQEIQASRALTELSQFKVDPQDLPAWVDTPTGKIIAQFRTFGYKQTGFVYNQVLREAVKGNFMPLTRYVITGVPASVAAATAKAAIKGQAQPYSVDDLKDPKKVASDVVKAMSDIGAGGLPGQEANNIYTSMKYGNTLQGVAGTVFGPTGSIVAETAVNIDKARAGNSQPLKKEAIRNIPGVGSILSNRIYPSKVTDATTRYFNALDKAAKTFKGDKKGAAEFSDYVAHSKNPENGKTIQASPAESLNNSRMLFANDKVRKAVVQFEKDGGAHAPSWDLPDDELKDYMQYKSQYTGDSAKSVLFDQFEHKYGDGSIKAIQDADSKFYDSLPKGKGSEPSKQTPTYPTFDDATKTVMATYNAASTEDKGKLMDQYGDIITDYFNKTATWTNAVRRAEGAPEKNDYPVASKEVQAIMKTYYALPTHDGRKGGNASRYAWIKANPEAYKKMQDYLSQSSLFSLIGEASKAQFKGTSPSQKLLKDIKNVGTYDIATYKDKDGNTVYGLNPTDAYNQSSSSGGSSYGSSSSSKMIKYFGDTSQYRVASPRTQFRTTKVNIKNGVIPGVKLKVADGKPVLNKKVALKRSKV